MNSPKQTKVKKIKFKVLAKKYFDWLWLNKPKNAMDDPESEMLSSKYYQPNEMTALFKNTNIFLSLT